MLAGLEGRKIDLDTKMETNIFFWPNANIFHRLMKIEFLGHI